MNEAGQWVGLVEPGTAQVLAPPSWLAGVPTNALQIVRDGRAYAATRSGAIDLYSQSGRLCGTISIDAPRIGLGRDGTVFGAAGPHSCHQAWWPALLR